MEHKNYTNNTSAQMSLVNDGIVQKIAYEYSFISVLDAAFISGENCLTMTLEVPRLHYNFQRE